VIHPSQIAAANDAFTPPAEEVENSRRVIASMEEARRAG
jgi:citrate lyase beta subunit